jgi:hypothetical protein
MKRTFLIIVIVSLCAVVAIGGNITFVMSNSVLKQNKPVYAEKSDVKVFVDLTENKLYLMNKNKMLKSYPLSKEKETALSPIGDWTIDRMEEWTNETESFWMGLNVPWGTFGIRGTIIPIENVRTTSLGCISMLDKDAAELYAMVEEGTQVKVYGGPYGAFGKGYRVLNYGNRGSDVYEVEKRLKAQGFYNGSIKGIYDETLRIAVHEFQKDRGLKISDNIGKDFYEKLGIILMDSN